MKLTKLLLLEANDQQQLQQIQEITKQLPNIFKEAITTVDYFNKRLPKLAQQISSEESAQLLDLLVNKGYDVIEVAEQPLLLNYFKDKDYVSRQILPSVVSSAIKDGYTVSNGEITLVDGFLSALLDLYSSQKLNQELSDQQSSLLISILNQVYDKDDITSDQIRDNLPNYISKIFIGDDDVYRLKCCLFIMNSNNLTKYGMPKDFRFDSPVAIDKSGRVKIMNDDYQKADGDINVPFCNLTTKQMKQALSGQQRVGANYEVTVLSQIKQYYDSKDREGIFDNIVTPIENGVVSRDILKVFKFISKYVLEEQDAIDYLNNLTAAIESDTKNPTHSSWYKGLVKILNHKVKGNITKKDLVSLLQINILKVADPDNDGKIKYKQSTSDTKQTTNK